MVDWLAGKRMKGTSSERTSLSATVLGGTGVGGWVELGRYTAGTTTTNLSVSSLPNKRYYMILENVLVSSDISHNQITFNDDTGSNYYRKTFTNGVAATSSEATHISNESANATPNFLVGYIANYASNEKMLLYHNVKQNTAGAATAPIRHETVAKWANTSNAFNKWNTYKNTAAAGSEVVVLGWDPADSHTSNFWQELGTQSITNSKFNLSFTAKKYLWVQIYVNGNSGSQFLMRFNSDSGNNYADRSSSNGGADGTTVNYNAVNILDATTPTFYNFFIINNTSNEKLIINHGIRQNTAGATTAPSRKEFVGKWTNTSSQITNISSTGSLHTHDGIIKVWGAD